MCRVRGDFARRGDAYFNGSCLLFLHHRRHVPLYRRGGILGNALNDVKSENHQDSSLLLIVLGTEGEMGIGCSSCGYRDYKGLSS